MKVKLIKFFAKYKTEFECSQNIIRTLKLILDAWEIIKKLISYLG
jgi:hypothetical protein